MSKQVFAKTGPPIKILYELLLKICHIRGENFFILSPATYKRALYLNVIDDFFQELTPYYKKSKLFYITREHSYKHFLTIVRQICNYHSIVFNNMIKYDKSNYDISYKIYLSKNLAM